MRWYFSAQSLLFISPPKISTLGLAVCSWPLLSPLILPLLHPLLLPPSLHLFLPPVLCPHLSGIMLLLSPALLPLPNSFQHPDQAGWVLQPVDVEIYLQHFQLQPNKVALTIAATCPQTITRHILLLINTENSKSKTN